MSLIERVGAALVIVYLTALVVVVPVVTVYKIDAILAAPATPVHEVTGTPPPPYTDPQLSITNALGGVGGTQGYGVRITTITKDLLADTNIPADIAPVIEAPAMSTATRFITVTAVCGSNAGCALDANEAICVRLGPSTDSPTINCTNTDPTGYALPHGHGGCYLTQLNQSCQFTVRPISSCTSYDTCRSNLWAITSPGGGLVTLDVAIAQ